MFSFDEEHLLYSPQGVQQCPQKKQLNTKKHLITKAPIADDEPVPAWHLEIIEERMARYEKEGFTGRPWDEVKKELLEKLTIRMKS
jgi:putative addiction module component